MFKSTEWYWKEMPTDRVRTATSSKHLWVPAPSPKILIETSAWGSTLGDPDAVGLWPILRNPGRAVSLHGGHKIN